VNAPRLISCYFAGAGDQWPRLARVLEFSARQRCPEWQVKVQEIVPKSCSMAPLTSAYAANTQKLDFWARAITEARDGDCIALLDTDTMIVGSLDPIWEQPFDLGYTTRAKGFPFPINAGVVFVRVNARSRAFLRQWAEENRRMLTDHQRHQVWRKRYGGINQAALGFLLEQGDRSGVQLATLPCREWNCEDASWQDFDPALTRIVHVKSGLRRAIFHGSPLATLTRLTRIWRGLERAALTAAAPKVTPPPRSTPAAPMARAVLPLRRRGRPRGPETIKTNVRLPLPVYDAYCRKANATDQSVQTVLKKTLSVHAP
jgi:hypothetical protein